MAGTFPNTTETAKFFEFVFNRMQEGGRNAKLSLSDIKNLPEGEKQLIYKNDQSLKINNTEKMILEKMINSPGKIFKREEIANLIDLNKERSIDVIVTRLRKKIEENPKNPKYLQTIRGEGYVLWIE